MRTVYTTIKISQPQYDVELFRFYRTGVGRQLYLKQSSITQNDSTATVRYHYDGACRIDSLRLGKDVVKAMSYNANGWLTRSNVSGPMLIKFPPVDPDLPVLPRPGQAKAVAHKGNIFNETLHYADAAAAGAPRYDGKISVRNCDNALTAYAYDCHGRLITSTSCSYRGGVASADFSTEYAYDRNANLLNVTRNGIIDNVRGIRTYGINNDISMTYSVNRLKSVTVTAEGADYEGRTGLPQFQSSGVDFTYDPNGNMISDAVRGITDIRYNRLNLPVRLTFADGHRQTIAYDGFGRKTKIDYAQGPETIFGGDLPAEQDYVITSSRVYAGPHIFADGQLEYSAFDGGYFNADGSPCYYITDWQGNNAAVVNSAGSIIQSAAYYPYGEPTVEPKGQRFLFGGKEREHAGGRNAYDFGPRSLLPYGCWPSPDILAEKSYPTSPFVYCGGDPINNIDPTGKIVKAIDEESILNVQNTLTIEEAYYVRFSDGILDKDWLNMSNSDSENMTALKALSNSDISYVLSTNSEFESDNKVITFDDNGMVGITLIPNADFYPSPDENVYIITKKTLPMERQATNTAHEAYGHAFFYELKCQGKNVDPFHRKKTVLLPPEIDPDTGLEVYPFGTTETNTELKNQIEKVESQALHNYRTRIK